MNSQYGRETAGVAKVERLCREGKIPFTVQRRAVMEHLAGRIDHPTADAVFAGLSDRLPGISRATVYRILEAFVALGVVRKIDSPEARARFDADTSNHHHVRCTCCGVVADIHVPAFQGLPLPEEADSGYRIDDYAVSFSGVCPACRTGADKTPEQPSPSRIQPPEES